MIVSDIHSPRKAAIFTSPALMLPPSPIKSFKLPMPSFAMICVAEIMSSQVYSVESSQPPDAVWYWKTPLELADFKASSTFSRSSAGVRGIVVVVVVGGVGGDGGVGGGGVGTGFKGQSLTESHDLLHCVAHLPPDPV